MHLNPSPMTPSWPGTDSEPMDLVFIEGFRCETVIGIYSSEMHIAQPLRIDLVAGRPRSPACRTDRIADTIDYGRVREALLQLMQTHKVKLLEALAEQIAQMLLNDFGAHWVRVAVAKPRKFDDVEAMGVAIERRK
jgi:dihydroneopterin aldolase